MTGDGWTVRRVESRTGFTSREVFTDPQGVEWVRAKSAKATEFELPVATPGLPPIRLKRRSRPFGKKQTPDVGTCDVCSDPSCQHPGQLAF